MEIFQDALGQLTPQFLIGSKNLNSSEMLQLSLLSARTKIDFLGQAVTENMFENDGLICLYTRGRDRQPPGVNWFIKHKCSVTLAFPIKTLYNNLPY